MFVSSMAHPRKVAYIWSQGLQDVCDDLPANPGRSSLVHGLIQALGSLENDLALVKGDEGSRERCDPGYPTRGLSESSGVEGRSKDESKRHSKAIVIPPDPDLATEACLRRYHDAAYVGRYHPEVIA